MTVLATALLSWTDDHGLVALRAMRDKVVEEIADGVTLTSISFEGGAGSGQTNRNPQVLLSAIMEVLGHKEGTGDPMGYQADFSGRMMRF